MLCLLSRVPFGLSQILSTTRIRSLSVSRSRFGGVRGLVLRCVRGRAYESGVKVHTVGR